MLKISISPAPTTALMTHAEEIGRVVAGNVAREIYRKSQERCPVNSGKLKGSGSIEPTAKGYDVVYDCDYALLVDSLPQSQMSSGTAHFLSGSFSDVIRGGVKVEQYN